MKTLIVIDMQKGFLKEKNYQNLIPKINELQNNYEKIIYTKFVNKDKSLFQTKLKWYGLKSQEEQQLCIEIKENSIILEKTTYGLSNDDIELIKSLNQKEIDICGVQTDACVYAIAFQLFDNDIFPNILFDYCETSKQQKKFIKKAFENQFGKVK